MVDRITIGTGEGSPATWTHRSGPDAMGENPQKGRPTPQRARRPQRKRSGGEAEEGPSQTRKAAAPGRRSHEQTRTEFSMMITGDPDGDRGPEVINKNEERNEAK